MVQELDRYSSIADLTTQDPMADWIEYNAKEMPYGFKDMLSASFEQAYYYGPFAKAYQNYRRLNDTEQTYSPEVLNKKFNTDAFKVPMSASLANDFIAMNSRRQELDAIINQGTGSIWTDTAPWLAGQLGGGIVDPVNIAGGAVGGAMAAPIRGAITRLGTEALIGGVIPAATYQAFAPEQGEDRSLSAFAQDVVLGAVIELGAHGIFHGGKKALSAGYNKIKAKGQEAAAKVQSYAEKAFANGKKVDVEQLIDNDTPPKNPTKGTPSENIPPVIDGKPPLKLAYSPINAKGDVVPVGDALLKEKVAHESLQEASGHKGSVRVYDYSNGRVAEEMNVLEHFFRAYGEFKKKTVDKLKNSLAAKLSKADFSRLTGLKYRLGVADRVELVPPLMEADTPVFWEYRKGKEFKQFDPATDWLYHGGPTVTMEATPESVLGLSGNYERIQDLYDDWGGGAFFRHKAKLSDVGPALYMAVDYFHAVSFADRRAVGGSPAIAGVKLRPDFKFHTMPVTEKFRSYYLPAAEKFKQFAKNVLGEPDLVDDITSIIESVESLSTQLDNIMTDVRSGDVPFSSVKEKAVKAYDVIIQFFDELESLAADYHFREKFRSEVSRLKKAKIAELKAEGYEGLFNDRFFDYEPAMAIFDGLDRAVGQEDVSVPPVLPDKLAEDMMATESPDEFSKVLFTSGLDDDSIKYVMDLIGDEVENIEMANALLGTVQDATFTDSLPDILRQLAPSLYDDMLEQMKNDFDVIEYGNGKRIILNEENLPKYDATPNISPEERARLENKIDHVDIDYSEEAAKAAPLIDEKFEAMKKVDSSIEEGEIQTLVSQLESNENMIPSVKKELEDLKKSGILFKRLSKVYETFSNCIIGGGK